MKVTEHLQKSGSPQVSFEILPPLKGKSIDSIYDHLDPLMEFKPPFINVTYHRSEQMFRKRADGSFEKVDIRKRPGTVGICAAIMNHYKTDAVPHLICGGFSREETENALIDLNFLGIDNVLVLRGDAPANESFFEPDPNGHRYAVDLLCQVVRMNQGIYLEQDLQGGVKTNFCIGVAGYPEKHFEAPNMQSDLAHLKSKVDKGADYITTQMFFDNRKYFDFVARCRETGIQVPIIPGLKPITTKKQLTILPHIFHVEIPPELSAEILACKSDKDVEMVGKDWLVEQCKGLLKTGVPGLHYYTLGKPAVIRSVVQEIL
jgi:methylenetetrahydrofolate reductase (NADPH)